jgi:uncharacterized membrane protein
MDASPAPSPPIRPALLLGFALGGFFDGILLHQILQWHHLLSLVPGTDLRAQVMWDGLFHAAMYGIAAWGLWGLWRRGTPGGRTLTGALLVGFGLWHVVDAALSHWVLGIHRVRVDAASPLTWDLGWLGAFGLLPLGLGLALLRSGSGDGGSRRAFAALALVALGAGGWALRPPPGEVLTAAVFRPGLPSEAIERGIAELGGRVVWSGPDLEVALIDLPAGRRWSLYAAGALMVSGAGVPVGCLGWSGEEA